MNKGKIKQIFKSRITIGIVCFILGGLLLGGKSGIDITQERYNQLLEMEKKVLGKDSTSNTSSNVSNNKDEENAHGIGEPVIFSNKDGVKVCSLTINSAKLIKDRNEFSDKKADKVVEIEYTYENIDMSKSLYISSSEFKVYDVEGNILETYPAGLDKSPQRISKGKKCTATMSFALNNKSNDLELEFYENFLNSKASAIFKITANN